MRSADRIAGAALLAIAIAFGVGAVRNYKYWGENGPGSGFLPVWLAAAMAVLAGMLLLRALRSSDPGPRWLPDARGLRRLGLVFGATVAMVALLGVLGMLVGTALFIVVVVRGLDRHSWPRTLGVAVSVAGAIYLIFKVWLKVPLPTGVWGF